MGLKPVIPPGLYKESSGGSGDVAGPASATDNALVRFDGTTGKLVQNSDVTLADAAASNVTMTAGTGLSLTLATLDGNKNLIFDPSGTGVNLFTKGITVTQATANASILASTGYSLTGSNATSMIDLAGTWNTTGAPTAIKLNITNTASDAASLLMDLQVGGVSKFSIRKDGQITAPGGINVYNGGPLSSINPDGINLTGTNYIQWLSRGVFYFTADGVLELLDSAGTSFGRICLGGTSNAFPALKRNGAGIDVRLADDSGYAALSALSYAADGTAGATGGTFTVISSITVKNGIVTAIAGS